MRHGVITELNVSSFLPLVQAPYSDSTSLPGLQSVVLNVTTPELIRNVVEELRRSKAPTQLLFLDNTRWEPASVSWIAQLLPHIQDFSYNAAAAFSDDAYHLVASFARLLNLAIYTHVPTFLTFPTHISESHFLHLRTLRLRLVNSERFLHWLQSLDGGHSNLETFDLRIFCTSHVGWCPVNTLNSILKGNSGTLKDLSLGVDYADLDEDFSNKGALPPMPLLLNG